MTGCVTFQLSVFAAYRHPWPQADVEAKGYEALERIKDELMSVKQLVRRFSNVHVYDADTIIDLSTRTRCTNTAMY